MRVHAIGLSCRLAVLLARRPAAPRAARRRTSSGTASIAPGQAIEIKGVNGDVRAEPSGSNEVEVVAVKRAQRDNPESVRIEVVPHAGGVTICAVYPSRDGQQPNECLPGNDGTHERAEQRRQRALHGARAGRCRARSARPSTARSRPLRLNGDVTLQHRQRIRQLLHDRRRPRAPPSTDRFTARWVAPTGPTRWRWHRQRQHHAHAAAGSQHRRQGDDRQRRHLVGLPDDVSGRVSRRKVEGTIGGGGRLLSLDSVQRRASRSRRGCEFTPPSAFTRPVAC